MKVKVDLSKKQYGGRTEIRLSIKARLSDGKVITMYANSNIFVNVADCVPDYKKNEEGKDIVKPDGSKILEGYHINTYDKKRLETDAIKDARKKSAMLKSMLEHIQARWEESDKSQITKDWLHDIVDRYNFPEKYAPKVERKDIYKLFIEYLNDNSFAPGFVRGNMVVIRAMYRWESYNRMTDRKDFHIDIDNFTADDLGDFSDYLKCEKELNDERPRIFAKILASYPEELKTDRSAIGERGGNYVTVSLKKLRAFFNWMVNKGTTTNKPFKNFEFEGEQYGAVTYLTIEERNQLYQTTMSSKALEIQKDIFVFQCCVGCRVSDLTKFTKKNINGDMLTYTPIKTHREGRNQVSARVPLNPIAMELIRKYDGQDKRGRLFPFISDQKYNEAIKKMLSEAGITRNVSVRNTLTGQSEFKPLNEVASSHLARRTFVTNIYKDVKDPKIIGEMSGHVDGSRSFERYRDIEDDLLRSIIK